MFKYLIIFHTLFHIFILSSNSSQTKKRSRMLIKQWRKQTNLTEIHKKTKYCDFLLQNFVFKAGRARTNRQILALCVGYYELFIGRRKEREERTSEEPSVGETDNGSDKGDETGISVFPREEGACGGSEEGIIPVGEWHWENDGETEGEIQDEMSSMEGTISG